MFFGHAGSAIPTFLAKYIQGIAAGSGYADTGKWLAPADIARVIHFLAGPDARLVTGSALSLAL